MGGKLTGDGRRRRLACVFCWNGGTVRRSATLMLLALVITGCGTSAASSPTSTPAALATATARPQQLPSDTGPVPKSSATAGPTGKATAVVRQPTAVPPKPVPTVAVSRDYASFTATICHSFGTRDANTIINALPYFQYNSGLRYGTMGDGEGQTADPTLLRTWLASAKVTCNFITRDVAGHGTLLASGWTQPGGWSLVELDTYGGHWKINDFTFGDRATLYNAMQTGGPIVPFRG